MQPLFIDYETRSALDLRKVGLWNYAHHASTDIWCMAWAFGDAEPQMWVAGAPLPNEVREHVASGGTVVAHNATFEYIIWQAIGVPRYGFPSLSLGQLECTMAACNAMALPAGLEDAATALGLPVHKDREGRALMLKMASPVRRSSPLQWHDSPQNLAGLYAYCAQDVRVEREIHKRVFPLSAGEREVWLADQRINLRGIEVDAETVSGALRVIESTRTIIDQSLDTITGGAVKSVTALPAMKEWLLERGYAGGITKPDIVEALATPLPDDVRSVLRMRQEAGKGSVTKYDALAHLAPAGRLHYAYQYHAAGTGRWSGRGAQTQNMTRDVPPKAETDGIIELVRKGDMAAIDTIYGPPITVLSRTLRPMLTAKAGHVLVGGDWSNVEGRGVAWFCGEDWKLRQFAAADRGDGPGIYELCAAGILGIPVAEVTKAQRQQYGKVPELAFGYQGGSGAAMRFGFKGTEAEAESIKRGWRARHPRVVKTWPALSAAAMEAVRRPNAPTSAGAPGREARYLFDGRYLWCRLPSGRVICYPYPKILAGPYGDQLTYMTVPSANDAARGLVIEDEGNSPRWARVAAHGGLLLENIVQGFCRDFLAGLILACDKVGMPVVIHTHDDCYIEVPSHAAEPVATFIRHEMNKAPEWAKGFPLSADVEIVERYGC